MLRKEPILFTPPAAYNALNNVANEGNVYVPGATTSPTIFTFMLRIWLKLTETKVFPSPEPDSVDIIWLNS